MKAGTPGRVRSIWIFTTGLDCDLHVAPAPPPVGAMVGLRLKGACAGDVSDYVPLRLRVPAAGVTVTSVQPADGRSTRCEVQKGNGECTWIGANDRVWPVDVTLGLTASASSLEVAVAKPACRNCRPFKLVVTG
jgi:hypothetical protein